MSRCGALLALLALWAPALAQTLTVVAVGDIVCDPASDNYQGGEGTASLAASLNPGAVLVLGDNQYEAGTLQAYAQAYEPTWGRFKTITYPVPGNHESNSGGAGYYAYFGARAGDPDKGYYSFDLGAWHLVALNSNCEAVGGCETGSDLDGGVAECH